MRILRIDRKVRPVGISFRFTLAAEGFRASESKGRFCFVILTTADNKSK
jgi:hypothetical protein